MGNQNQNNEPTKASTPAAPAAQTAPSVPTSPPAAAPAPTGPSDIELQLAAMQAKLDAQAAELAALKDRPALSAATTDAPMSAADIAQMAGLGGGTRNSRDEEAPVPRHFTTGLPIFKAERPTGRAG